MYRAILAILLLQFCLTASLPLHSQSKKVYASYDSEFIFAFNTLDIPGETLERNFRFSVFPHFDFLGNRDFGKHFGVWGGVAHRNIGLKYTDTVTVSHRSLALGAPLGIKLGDLQKGLFFFGGIEPELMYHYKSQYRIGDEKFVEKEFLSDKLNLINVSIFGGVELGRGFNIKFKYYLDDFFHTGYLAPDGTYPFLDTTSGIWYISVGMRSYLGKR